MKRKIKVTVSRLRRARLVLPQTPLRLHCLACGREVELVHAAQAAAVLEIAESALALLIAAGQVHAVQTVNGQLVICKDSLFVREQFAQAVVP